MTPLPPRDVDNIETTPAVTKGKFRPWQLILLGSGALLVWAALREVQWPALVSLLAGLGLQSVAIILLVSVILLPLMTARWWWLLRLLGQPISLLTLVVYRTAGNAVGYFTPGPQFGGEPLLVLLLQRQQLVPTATATLSVVLDRLLELIAGFAILLGSLALASSQASLSVDTGLGILLATAATLAALLVALLTGARPFSRFLSLGAGAVRRRWSEKAGRLVPTIEAVANGEVMAEKVFQQAKGRLLMANLFSLFHWLGVFGECWLFCWLFGYSLTIPQLAAVVVAMRLAFLSPIPAGIGLCLVVRARDLLFGLAGMILGMKYLTNIQKSVISSSNRLGD